MRGRRGAGYHNGCSLQMVLLITTTTVVTHMDVDEDEAWETEEGKVVEVARQRSPDELSREV